MARASGDARKARTKVVRAARRAPKRAALIFDNAFIGTTPSVERWSDQLRNAAPPWGPRGVGRLLRRRFSTPRTDRPVGRIRRRTCSSSTDACKRRDFGARANLRRARRGYFFFP